MFELLEARILFSADGFAVGVFEGLEDNADLKFDNLTLGSVLESVLRRDATGEGSHQITLSDDQQQTIGAPQFIELIVIDLAVDDLDVLLDQIAVKPNVTFEFLTLESNVNGIDKIERFLNDHGPVDAIHIISHGADGVVELGDVTLTNDSLDLYRPQLQGWTDSLAIDADILFYGCDLAASDNGRELVDALAVILDSDVAASEDTTGHQSLGGNWSLEYNVGDINTGLFLSDAGVQSYASTLDITTGLVGHWQFESNLDDTAGGNNATFATVGDYYVTGGAAGSPEAIALDSDAVGSNNYLIIPNSAAYDFGTGDFSIALWYNTATVGAAEEGLVGKLDSVEIHTQNTDELVVNVGGGGQEIVAPGAFKHDANWHHVAVVRETGELTLYVDGVIEGSPVTATQDVNTPHPYLLGATSQTTNDYDGNLDDARIYNRALSVDDVYEVMGSVAPGSAPTLSVFSTPVEITTLNTEVEITFAELVVAGDEADDIGVTDFQINAVVPNGTLKIGPDSITATPFVAGSNDTVSPTSSAFWTPDTNVSGVLDALEVVAVDGQGATSATAVVAQVEVLNSAPTLTEFSSYVDVANVNTEQEISFTEILASANESDIDGTVTDFRVVSVLSGTLRIGIDSATASAFSMGINDTVNATNKAFWTPDTDVIGTENAFELVAVDNDNAESVPAVSTTVNVVNEQPTLTLFDAFDGYEDTELEINYGQMIGFGNESDVDGTVERFVVEGVSTGSLLIGSTSATATPFAPGSNDIIDPANKAYWTPAANENGAVDSISVKAEDNFGAQSSTAVVVPVDLAPVSDPPDGGDRVISVTNDTSHVFVLYDFAFSDPIDGDSFSTVRIDSVPVNGRLELLGAGLVQAGDIIQIADITSGNLIYSPALGAAPDNAYDSFTFSVGDDGTAGPNYDVTPNEIRVVVREGIVDLSGGIELNNDGGNDAYLVTDNPLGFDATEFTWEVKFTKAYTTDEVVLASYATSQSSDEFVVSLEHLTDLHVLFGAQLLTLDGVDYRTALLDGKLHSLGFTWNSTTGSWVTYIDGILVDQGRQYTGAKPDFSNGSLVLGQEQDSINGGFDSSQVFSGAMYDMRFWDRALQPTEVNSYHAQKFDPANLPANLVVNWQMDGFNANNKIVDVVSGNNLSVAHAVGSGFSPSEVILVDLHVNENSPNGTQVGYVVPVDQAGSVNLVQDASFTEHGYSRNQAHLAITGNFGAWEVISGNIDIAATNDTYPSPVNGDIIDLAGNVPGTIKQVINTVPGVEYELKFLMAANGNSGADNLQSVRVTADTETQIIEHKLDTDYWSQTNPLWSEEGFRFVASSSTAEIRFQSLEPANRGPFLSHVVVRTVPPVIDSILSQYPDLSYDPATSKFYQPVTSQQLNWVDADAAARATLVNDVPGRLIRIETQHENNYVESIISAANPRFWTGGNDSAIEDRWVWGDGNQFWQGDDSGRPIDGAFTGWRATEPNDWQDEDYLEVTATGWNDHDGTAHSINYIIEWDANEFVNQYQFEFSSAGNSDANGRFAINKDTGEITVADASQLDFEVDAFHDVDVRVIDEMGHSYTETLRIDVCNINESPNGIDKAVTIDEDTAYSFSATDFPLQADAESDVLSGIVINTLPSAGTLMVGSQSVAVGQSLSLSQLNNLSYTPAQNDSGVYSFEFSVVDDGGTVSSGIDTDPTPNTFTITVVASNDEPAGTTGSINILEDQTRTLTSSDFGFSDLVEGDNFLSVIMVSASGSGDFTLNGNALLPNQEILVSDIDSGLLRFEPSANVYSNASAAIVFQVRDDGGIANTGVDTDQSANTLTINILSVNDAPAGTDGVVSLLEDETAIITTADFGFTDSIDNNTHRSVMIDALPGNGVLELNGVAVAVGQQVGVVSIQANNLTYTPNDHLYGPALDQIQFRVRDDGGTLNGGADTDPVANTLQFNVTPVNDEPDINDRTIIIDEEQTYQFALANFSIIDIENNSLLDITIDTLPSLGTLMLSGSPVAAGVTIPAADLNNLTFTPAPDANGVSFTSFNIIVRDDGGVANGGVDSDSTANSIVFSANSINDAPISASFTSTMNEDGVHAYQLSEFAYSDVESDDFTELLVTSLPSNGVLAVNNMPVAIGQAIARADIIQLTYTPQANATGSAYDSFTFRVKDSGGIANGGVDTSGQYSALIDIVPVNDPPTSTGFTVSATEDTAYTFSASQFVITDIENHALNSIIISTLPSSGLLTLGGSAVVPGQFVPANSISNLVYTPDLHVNGIAADLFTFQVVDNGGVLNGGSDTDTAQNTVIIDVLSVNDAPVGSSDVVAILEDSSHTFSVADFGFTDVDNNRFQSLTIQSPPTNGTLTLSGAVVTAGQVISVSQVGNLVFTPQPGANQAAYDSFEFLVTDDGGTANGGADTDTVVKNIIINVGNMNDAPTGADVVASTLEDTPYTFRDSDFGFTDSDNNNLQHIIIDSLPVGGVLELSGVPIASGQTVVASRLADITYTPMLNAFGSSLDNFDFRVVDDGGTDNGGVDTALQSNTWSIDVLSVNDAPQAINAMITTAEDTTFSFSGNEFGFSDPDSNALDLIIIQTLPVNGQLVLSGVPVVIGQTITTSAISDLSYIPVLHGHGAGFDSFEFAVQDNGGITNGGDDTSNANATLFVNVTAVNDAPQSSDKTITVLEDAPFSFSTVEFDITDIEGHNLQSVIISALPALGQLSLNGIPVAVSQVISVAAISDLLYMPPANAHGVAYASFSYHIQDDGGVANGGQDTSTVESVIGIDVLSVNDAPQAFNTVVSTNEDTPYQFSLNDIGFTDSDSDALQSVTVATLPTNGELYLAGVPVALNQSVIASDVALLEYIPDPHANGVALDHIDFIVVDDGGTNNGGADTAVSVSRVQVDVISVNDPPSGSDTVKVLLEDSIHVLTLADFGFSDVEDSNALQSVRIDSLPATGQLALAGVPVVAGQVISRVDLVRGDLEFTPLANTSGLAYSEIQFSVIDDGGVANGGLNTDLNASTLTFDVLAVNDPPQSADQTITATEDTDYIFSLADFVFSDPADLHGLDEIVIETLPGTGALLLSGVELAVGQSVSLTDLLSANFVYRPAADMNGSGLTSFTFKVQDDGLKSNGGNNLSVDANTITIDVHAVNDAPQMVLTEAIVDEGGERLLDATLIKTTDVDDSQFDLLLTLEKATRNGVLLLNGAPMANGTTFTVAQLNNNEVYYIHDGSETSDDTFILSLRDGEENNALPVFGEFTITVNEVIDPMPELVADIRQVEFGQTTIAASVIDNDILLSPDHYTLSIEREPENGVVTINDDGTFIYVHNGENILNDSFSYRVTNSDDLYQIATVTIEVEPQLETAIEVPFEELLEEPLLPAKPVIDLELANEEEELTVEKNAEVELETALGPEGIISEFSLPQTRAEIDDNSQSDSVVIYTEQQVETNFLATLKLHEIRSLDVKQHNRLDLIALDAEGTSNTKNLLVNLEVKISDFRDVTDNNYFLDALARVDDELSETATDNTFRTVLGSEAVFGVSISATAGILAWALRGGALFASMMAATPLWNSIDPVRVMVGKATEKDTAGDSVEKVFD